jgi:hypothetical protein
LAILININIIKIFDLGDKNYLPSKITFANHEKYIGIVYRRYASGMCCEIDPKIVEFINNYGIAVVPIHFKSTHFGYNIGWDYSENT